MAVKRHTSTGRDAPIAPVVLRRITAYFNFAKELQFAGVGWVSSSGLAAIVGSTPSTVRQDLSHVRVHGVSKRGYSTEELAKELAGILGADSTWRLVVVGAGNLGRALAMHGEFGRRGYRIVGVFDVDPEKIGSRMGSLTVRGMRELGATIQRRSADIGVIAVPSRSAQGVADLLVACGIRGILNVSLGRIIIPRRVPVVESRMIASLQELCHAMGAGRSRATALLNR